MLLLATIAGYALQLAIILLIGSFIFEAFDFFFVPAFQIMFSMCMPIVVSIIIYFIISLAIKKGGLLRSTFNWVLRIFALLICLVVFVVCYVEIPFTVLVQYGKWALGISVTFLFVLNIFVAIRNPD